ncbi:unnamed protein product, partial [Brenthis ino]
MSHLSDITDEDFIPFLHSLGVETYKKSFEWMLNDPDFSEVLRWIYSNLDHNNALTEWEECRYAELEKKEKLLPLDKLERKISSIQNEFIGLCLPGDEESMEDMKLDIIMQKERIAMLEKHEEILNELLVNNEQTKEDLTLEVTKLNATQLQCSEDEVTAGEECMQLAENIECITNDVVQVIANALNLFASCNGNKELAKRFFTYGPFESYRQSQALFKSHFDLFTSKKFNKKQNDNTNDEDLRTALIEAKNMEEWLSDAVCSYIETKADLYGEQAKLLLISNYNNVHPSQITVYSMEAQSAIELLEQEEGILEQQLQNSVKHYVERRTSMAVEVTAKSALAIREQIYKDLTYLSNITSRALTADRTLYAALRRELRLLEELLHFAAQLREYQLQEFDTVASRIKSMNDISSEQEAVEKNLQSSNVILNAILSISGYEPSADVLLPIKLDNELSNSIRELKDNIKEGYKTKENSLEKIKESMKPLKEYIWDGCTKQPNCYDRSVSAMTHSLRQEMEKIDSKVVSTSGEFNGVKNGDKHNVRKLWQWFLTDQARLLHCMKSINH